MGLPFEGELRLKTYNNGVRRHEDIEDQGGACTKDKDHNDLWYECAGPLVSIPCVGEKVFYFPQGQLEQIEDDNCTNIQEQLPSYNLPSKILCEVMEYKLKADKETDELFADIVLLPVSESCITEESETRHAANQRQPSKSFCKILTTSDSNGHAGVIIFKRNAEECFPPLDMTAQLPTQELVAKDLNGNLWTFTHIYRGEPKRHSLMTAEWRKFMKAKRLAEGDACIFLKGINGGLYIGVRRAKKANNFGIPRLLSIQSMKIGVLATAYHALSTTTPFTVCYRPRSSTSRFIVPYKQYMESLKNTSSNMECMMKFEGKDFQEEIRKCVVVGSEDLEPAMWSNSMWKCLKVRWEGSPRNVGPERVSPWDLFPVPSQMESSSQTQVLLQQPSNSSPTFKLFGYDIARSQDASPMSNSSSAFAPGASSSNVLATPLQSPMSHSVKAHTFKKVLKFGSTYGKVIDLCKYSGYLDLLEVLDKLFGFEGNLTCRTGGWDIVYKDENDVLNLTSGCQWHEFLWRVRTIHIYPAEEIEKLQPRGAM